MEWFDERLHRDWRQGIRIREVVFEERTEHQELLIFDSYQWGRVLALDGVVQTTTGDEFCYHEMIVHVPMLAHGSAREVLIVGGGDGGCLREALKHGGVERVTQVEIDRSVIDLCVTYLPSISAGAFDHPKARVLIADGAKYVAETEDRYDVVIIDSTDPVGPGAVLFTTEFYGGCRRLLRARRGDGDPVRQSLDQARRAGPDPARPEGRRLRAGRLLPARDPDLYRRRHGVGLRHRRAGNPPAQHRPAACGRRP